MSHSNKTKKQHEAEEKMDPMIEENDRLSSLPDDLIQKILSFNDTKDAIKMSCLSSRWRLIWTTMPCLTFSDWDYRTISEHVLSGRDNQRGVTSVKLMLYGYEDTQVFAKRILDYAFSHNVEQLDITWFYKCDEDEFPLSLFSSQSLKHLTLKADCCYRGRNSWPKCDHDHDGCDDGMIGGCTLTSKWEVPALTTLHLDGMKLLHANFGNFSGLISECVNLKTLSISNFEMMESGLSISDFEMMEFEMMESGLDICHPQLSELNIDYVRVDAKVLYVSAPQLRNLNIRHCSGAFVVSAPDLAHLNIWCNSSLNLTLDDFHSLETVDLRIIHPNEQEPHKLFGLLQRLHSVKFLKLNTEILEILSSSVELLSHQDSPFTNLKRLKVYPLVDWPWELKKEANVAIEVINFILDNSPNATFVMVSYEEMLAENKAKRAKRHMADLRLLLKNLEMVHTNRCWDLCGQIEQGTKKIDDILDELRTIKSYITELPEMLPRFYRVCEEADIAMSKITNRMKTHFDEYQIRVNANFRDVASPLL